MTRKVGKKKLSFSIGIMSHNEGQNIGHLLDSIINQTCWTHIKEILIISSGSTDNTNNIVKSFSKKYPKVILITEKVRNGKAQAVNIFLSKTKEDIVVLMSGDLLLKKTTLALMIRHFINADIGIVGSHPVPLNNKSTFIGFAVNLMWELHHLVSLKQPKMGELIAFRRILKKIPTLSVVDEVNIEAVIRGQGYNALYEPKAIVFNKGPESIKDFITVRRRNFAGHLATKFEYSYSVSTLDTFTVLSILITQYSFSIYSIFFIPGTIILEFVSRILGFIDYKWNIKNHSVWDIALTTKKLK